MSTTAAADRRESDAAPPAPEWWVALACAGLLAAASLPLARAFIGWEFARPVGAAIALSLGGQMLARRAGAGGLAGVVVGVVAWTMFVALAFLPSEVLLAGVVPTLDTVRAGAALFVDGVELLRTSPAPTSAEPELLALAVSGVWWIAHAVDVLAIRLRSPLHAIAGGLVLWTVPLALAPASSEQAWYWAVPFLVAAVAVLLVTSDSVRRRVDAAGGGRAARPPAAGWVTGAGAIVVGALLVGYVPGFGEDPLVQPGRVGGGLTQTDNPIVDIRSKLVDLSDQPVVHVETSEPTYLRMTSLDRYSANERWTNDGISGAELNDRLRPEASQLFTRTVDTEIQVSGASGAVLVPAPYQPQQVAGPRRDDMRWDPEMATLTMATGERLENGDRYEVTATVPNPPVERLREVDVADAPDELTHLPAVPEEVSDLARRLVDEAGADNAYDAALALQRELRSWEYSLEPPPGHGESDMVDFLRSRQGYCEQYAGTMAVMLRSLDIPARVGVGYTAGKKVGDDEYLVRERNAHAWVEVLFPGYGWIRFEPTPRDDRNLLTPDAGTVAPDELDSQRQDPADDSPDVDFGEDETPSPDELAQQPDAGIDDAPEGDGASAGGGDDRGTAPWWWLGASVVGLVGAGVVLARRRAERPAMVPAAAVLAHLERVERLGAGLGRPRAASETDAEYIRAIAGQTTAGQALVAAANRARWAPVVPREAVEAARDGEQAVRRSALEGRGRAARTVVSARGWWYAARRRLSALSLRLLARGAR